MNISVVDIESNENTKSEANKYMHNVYSERC